MNSQQPTRVIVNFGGMDHTMNVGVCRLALVRRQAAGEFPTMDSLAGAIGRSRSTVSRFFAGRQISLPVTLAILARLKLNFDDVFTPCAADERDGD